MAIPASSYDPDDPQEAVDVLLYPFRWFAGKAAAGGILLIIATVAALFLANSPWHEEFFHLWELYLTVGVESFQISKPLHIWINDGLMAMFFFVVGLEIKREILTGELSSPGKALLPIVAAIGGLALPAIIYSVLNFNMATSKGWGIPMATDIAFALGVLTLLGNRVPVSLKVFLTAVAIVDDLGAVLVIAFFYSSNISLEALAIGATFFSILVIFNLIGVRNPLTYAVFGVGGVWLAFLLSGVHPTIAGVLAAFTIPARTRIQTHDFADRSSEIIKGLKEATCDLGDRLNRDSMNALLQLRIECDKASSPLQRLEKSMHPWVIFLIMPLFAFANAGVRIEGDFMQALSGPLPLGIILGLIFGKQIGITLFAWIAVKLGIADLPDGVSWRQIYFVAWLGGIGFTMSLFVATLAFHNVDYLNQAKLATLVASMVAGAVGYVLLRFYSPAPVQADRA